MDIDISYVWWILNASLQRLLPLKRALTEVEHDVRDTHDAIEEVSPNITSPRIDWLLAMMLS